MQRPWNLDLAPRRGRGAVPTWAASIALLLAAGPASALPLLSEVFYDATGSDNGQSFVEIYGDPGTLLDGFSIEGVNGSNGAVATSSTRMFSPVLETASCTRSPIVCEPSLTQT